MLQERLHGKDVTCHACGYNLRDAGGVQCPECGTVIAMPVPDPRAGKPTPGGGKAVTLWAGGAMVLASLFVIAWGVQRIWGLGPTPMGRAAGRVAAGAVFIASFPLMLMAASLLRSIVMGGRLRVARPSMMSIVLGVLCLSAGVWVLLTS